MQESRPQVIARYSGIIASIANGAIDEIEGIRREEGLVKYKFGLKMLKDRNVHVDIEDDLVIIDMFVDVDFGYSIPEVVCLLQEKIKAEVEAATKFKVKKINVNVANITFSEPRQ
ncbi:MAG TPA: Asp23/Gls24 family envelope stress response protein [Candidatus Stercoripulliclostridium merdipullorum]|uniref:Asp23/Gls24 family envelope stress response protein n=1 Tax=Candidatus Stercoripulliclostridium merdipullorum TaxID=2840952 RepID=A0A9D1SWZ6_9FIRM|nr:Asp23/Gls24 family envelope stress response protein [Candidatus Stercoripulliclostridium merdipullorum]